MLKTLLVVGSLLAAAVAAQPQTLPQMRMTPAEIGASSGDDSKVGSSGLAGIHTKVVFGDPSRTGFYSTVLFAPAHATIQAHSYRYNRIALVVFDEWNFGYGDHFGTAALKTLPPGSIYSEPAGLDHFARTEGDAVIVEISGYGPADTRYFDPADDPSASA